MMNCLRSLKPLSRFYHRAKKWQRAFIRIPIITKLMKLINDLSQTKEVRKNIQKKTLKVVKRGSKHDSVICYLVSGSRIETSFRFRETTTLNMAANYHVVRMLMISFVFFF